jgi:hypothetical protein
LRSEGIHKIIHDLGGQIRRVGEPFLGVACCLSLDDVVDVDQLVILSQLSFKEVVDLGAVRSLLLPGRNRSRCQSTANALHLVLANLPAIRLKQRRDAAITVTSILANSTIRLGERIFVFAQRQLIALCAAWLVHQPARPPLTHALFLSMIYSTASSFRA